MNKLNCGQIDGPMKLTKVLLSGMLFFFIGGEVLAQEVLSTLTAKYKAIDSYQVNVNYVAESDALGYRDEQNGVLKVVGDKYLMKFGENETWLSDGKAEYIGSKEEDHSELIIFCYGENFEIPVGYGSLFNFYMSGVKVKEEGDNLQVESNDGAFKSALITIKNGTINSVSIIDEVGMSHTYTFSNFSNAVGQVNFSINPKDYADTIDERSGCK